MGKGEVGEDEVWGHEEDTRSEAEWEGSRRGYSTSGTQPRLSAAFSSLSTVAVQQQTSNTHTHTHAYMPEPRPQPRVHLGCLFFFCVLGLLDAARGTIGPLLKPGRR